MLQDRDLREHNIIMGSATVVQLVNICACFLVSKMGVKESTLAERNMYD